MVVSFLTYLLLIFVVLLCLCVMFMCSRIKNIRARNQAYSSLYFHSHFGFTFELRPAFKLKRLILAALGTYGFSEKRMWRIDVNSRGFGITVWSDHCIWFEASALNNFHFRDPIEGKFVLQSRICEVLNAADEDIVIVYQLDGSNELSFLFGDPPSEEFSATLLEKNAEWHTVYAIPDEIRLGRQLNKQVRLAYSAYHHYLKQAKYKKCIKLEMYKYNHSCYLSELRTARDLIEKGACFVTRKPKDLLKFRKLGLPDHVKLIIPGDNPVLIKSANTRKYTVLRMKTA